MTSYIDLFIRSCNGDPVGMDGDAKNAFIRDYLFEVIRKTVKNRSDYENISATELDDVNSKLTQLM